HRGQDVAFTVERGQYQDPHARGPLTQLGDGTYPGHPGHAQVHQHHVDLSAVHEVEHFLPVRGLGDDLDAVLGREGPAQAVPHHRVVVGDQQPDHGPASGPDPGTTGTLALTAVPLPASLSISTLPQVGR